MNFRHLLGFLILLFSFFQFSAEGAGSFIALDIVAIAYFLVHPNRLLVKSKVLIWMPFALMTLIFTRIIIGANEFAFLARVGLIFIDAFFLHQFFRSNMIIAEDKMCSRALLVAGTAYAAAFFLWMIAPDGNEIFYLNSTKAWIATFPALFAAAYLIIGKPKAGLVFSIAALSFSFVDSSVSRALLLQSTIMALISLWHIDRRLAKFGILLAGIGSLIFVGVIESFVEKHEHSNTFRMIMILQILDFSAAEFILGRGVDMWRIAAFDVLFDMPGAEAFFETANPHFFPAEVIIRGGLALFICIFGAFYFLFRRSSVMAIPAVMLMATFFTTNTGVERLYMTLAIFILLSARGDWGGQVAIIRKNKMDVGISSLKTNALSLNDAK